MKKLTIAAAITAAAMAMTACATNVGTQTVNDFGRYQQLTNGQTTKVQLHGVFGQPHAIQKINQTGESIWSYFQISERTNPTTYIPFVGLATGGSDLNITQADFYFDADEVLIRSQREQRSRYKNMWLGMGDAFTRSGQVDVVRQEMERLGLPFDEREAKLVAGWADAAD